MPRGGDWGGESPGGGIDGDGFRRQQPHVRPASAGAERPPRGGAEGTAAAAAAAAAAGASHSGGPYLSSRLLHPNTSSTSLNSSISRNMVATEAPGYDNLGPSALQRTVALGHMDATHAPEPTADAPFLATAEAHLGRMTLTAPDNMRRRKAEEREKRRKARKRKAERAETAVAALHAARGPGRSAATSATPLLGLPTTTTDVQRPSATAGRPPLIGTSRSTSNLASLGQQHHASATSGHGASSRPQSPTRRSRPRSAQSFVRNESSPERHAERDNQPQPRPQPQPEPQVRQRPRRRREPRTAASSQARNAATSQPAQRSQGQGQSQERQRQQALRAEVLRRVSTRRRDIYAELPALGLPGASDDEMDEPPPPPFPPYANRPISPPPQPAEGQEWSEEMRRRQEEYLANRVPDSPPPAFYSDGEDNLQGHPASHPPIGSDGDASSSEGEQVDGLSQERASWTADAAAGFSFEERVERERVRREERERLMLATLETPNDPVAPANTLPNQSLGQLVNEARAKRGLRSEGDVNRVGLPTDEAVDQTDDARPTSAEVESVPPATEVPQSSLMHRRTASDGTSSAAKAQLDTVRAVRRSNNAAIGTGRGLVTHGEREMGAQQSQHKPTKIRARPSAGLIASHSRFRDDAAAAAHRRRELWASAMRDATRVQVSPVASLIAPMPLAPTIARADDPAALRRERAPQQMSQELRHSSSGGRSDAEEDSPDSDAAWEKEERQFERMRRQDERPKIESSSEEDGDAGARNDATMRIPGSMPIQDRRSDLLVELGKVGKSVPRAPPPLVLGRSRGGGAAYSSSSESSSESDVRRFNDDDESDSDSPFGEDAASEHELPAANSRDTLAIPAAGPIGKGKQPMRSASFDGSTSKSPSTSSNRMSEDSARAGHFEAVSGSSDDFSDSEKADDEVFSVRHHHKLSEGIGGRRSDVGDRLKYLFSTPLPAGSDEISHRQSRESAERASVNSDYLQRAESRSFPTADRHLSGAPLSAAAPPVARRWQPQRQGPMSESRARSEALKNLSQLQRSADPLPPGVDRDALAALERLLVRSSGVNQALLDEPSKLTRTGAINGRTSFVNPRSSIAPRPLGRLPTITDATRHFPTAQRNEAGERIDTVRARREQLEHQMAPSQTPLPSWMARIPAREGARLQPPLEPTKQSSTIRSDNHELPRPSVHSSRVTAIAAAFEGQNKEPSSTLPMPTPPRSTEDTAKPLARPFDQNPPSVTQPGPSRTISQLRRRPPPPPPPSKMLASTSSNSNLSLGDTSGEREALKHQAFSSSAIQANARGGNRSDSNSSTGSSMQMSGRRPPPPLPLRDSSMSTSMTREQTAIPANVHETAVNHLYHAEATDASVTPAQQRREGSGQPRSSSFRPLPVPPSFQPSEEEGLTDTVVPLSGREHFEQMAVRASSSADADQTETCAIQQQALEQTPSGAMLDPAIFPAPVTESSGDRLVGLGSGSTPAPSVSTEGQGELLNGQGGQQTHPQRQSSFGLTDLDLFASRLADARAERQGGERPGNGQSTNGEGEGAGAEADAPEGAADGHDTYDDLHLLAEFLGPARAPGLTPAEMEMLPVGRVEVTRRRIVGKRDDGRDKVKLSLAVAGVKVERCAVCLVQFKEGNLACVFPCMHVLHEKCAMRLLRNTKLCPTCRAPVM